MRRETLHEIRKTLLAEVLLLLPTGFLAELVYRSFPRPLSAVSFDPFTLLPLIAALASLRYILAYLVTLFLPVRSRDGNAQPDVGKYALVRGKTRFWCFIASLGFAAVHMAGIGVQTLLLGETTGWFAGQAGFVFLIADLVPILVSGAVWLIPAACTAVERDRYAVPK